MPFRASNVTCMKVKKKKDLVIIYRSNMYMNENTNIRLSYRDYKTYGSYISLH